MSGVVDRPQESLAPVALESAYAMALAFDRARDPMTVPGHRLYWIAGSSVGALDAPAGSSLILGRHTHADVVLDRDPMVSLRHLLVRSALLDDGCAQISLLDLDTHARMQLASGAEVQSLAAVGSLIVRVGAYVLVALPTREVSPERMPASTCEIASAHPYRSPPRRLGDSIITLLPHPVSLSSEDASRPDSQGDARVDEYEVTLASRAGRARAVVTGTDLDRGLLIGRAPRCVNLLSVLNCGISRVHLVLVRTRTGVTAFDAASVQGTYDAWSRRIRSTVVEDEGTILALGADLSRVTLFWRRRR